MKLLRGLIVGVVVAALAVAFVADEGERPDPDRVEAGGTLGQTTTDADVWFCPGGSAPGGVADVSLELINVGDDPATTEIAGLRSGPGGEPRTQSEIIGPGERRLVRLADLVVDSPWVGAVVEVLAGDVVVEQTAVGADFATTDRATCHTTTSDTWVLASGATRVAEFGETNTILVLNPFLEDAVLDVAFDADVGVDSLEGVVAPARRVTAIDVTDAVTVAGRVSAVIDVVAGRVAVSRIQVVDGADQVGLSVTPGSASVAPVWFLPNVNRAERSDIITVVNPSTTEEAEVDLEIVADGTLSFDPIELTLRPGRVAVVDVAAEVRLDGVESMSVIARSLNGVPVAVMNESFLAFGEGRVSNLSATVGTATMATAWVAPIEQDDGGLVVYNPGSGIVTATVSEFVDGELVDVVEVELGGGRRAILAASAFSTERPLVRVDAPTPIVVGREARGVSVHAQLVAIPAEGVEPLS
ncbi:MAG: hypothetical protein AAF548_05710 [Actinomycetota bacterium]